VAATPMSDVNVINAIENPDVMAQGNVKHLPPANAVYTIASNEKYVNSGWLLAKGQQQGFPGSSTTFMVTFQKAGTYNYLCEIHP
jgi:plastocyanin